MTIRLDGMSLPAGSFAEGFDGQPDDRRVVIRHEAVKGSYIELPAYALRVIPF